MKFRALLRMITITGLMLPLFAAASPTDAGVSKLTIHRRTCGTVTAVLTYDNFSEGNSPFYVAFTVDLNDNGIFGEVGEQLCSIQSMPAAAIRFNLAHACALLRCRKAHRLRDRLRGGQRWPHGHCTAGAGALSMHQPSGAEQHAQQHGQRRHCRRGGADLGQFGGSVCRAQCRVAVSRWPRSGTAGERVGTQFARRLGAGAA